MVLKSDIGFKTVDLWNWKKSDLNISDFTLEDSAFSSRKVNIGQLSLSETLRAKPKSCIDR